VPDSPARADRPDTPSPADREPRPDRPASAENQRRTRALEALPPGHPSSPYQADGSRRPAEPSLRSLELPIPDEIAEEWGMVPSSQNKGASDRGNSGDWASNWNEWGAGTGEPAGTDGGHSQERGGNAHGQDGNTGWESWDDNPGGDDGNGGRDYDADGASSKADDAAWSISELTGENHGQAGETGDGFVPAVRGKHGTADNTTGRARDDNAQTADAVPPPEAIHRYYWTEVPRFKSMWGNHESSWPKESQPAAKIDRSGDPPGSWRTDSNLLLSPEKHDRTKEAISEVHGVESHVTEDLRQIKDESPHSAELVGLEFRRKGEDRLKEKVAEVLSAAGPDATPQEVVNAVPDAIRYTFRFSKEDYTSGYQDISRRMEERGYELHYNKNHWEDSGYKGINTRWLTPQGQRFEVQFHTPESYHAKQEVTHEAYERIRNPLTTDEERLALDTFQAEVCSWIPAPAEATTISDIPKKGY
jgi:hypothetical protein